MRSVIGNTTPGDRARSSSLGRVSDSDPRVCLHMCGRRGVTSGACGSTSRRVAAFSRSGVRRKCRIARDTRTYFSARPCPRRFDRIAWSAIMRTFLLKQRQHPRGAIGRRSRRRPLLLSIGRPPHRYAFR